MGIKLLSSPEVRHCSTTQLASNRTLSGSTEALTSAPSSSSHQEWMSSPPALTADHSRPQHLLVGRSSKEAAENQEMGFFFLGGGSFFQGLRCRTWNQVKDVASPQAESGKHEIKTGRETALECWNYDSVQVLGHFPTICSLC